MSDEAGKPTISNTLTNAAHAPVSLVMTVALFTVAFMLGLVVATIKDSQESNAKDAARTYTELRLMQEHISNLNAVLISRGVIKPGDVDHPAEVRP